MLPYKKDVSSQKYAVILAYAIIIIVCVVSSISYVTNIREKKVQNLPPKTQKISPQDNNNLNQPLHKAHALHIAIALTTPIDQLLEYYP